ncbi:hypothetical protein GCM10012280_31150 [Wenjunlia tyrosinilytica]|uniref:Signal transduction histidine kinase subgroup 3 dimerisation and phosphoacceptor domain-containing protein n=1 Tax=Wenjunlia tyrosinilytica TaxID=1544741 RepID=A0A918DYJ5_9ACTN|nr:hypothetical protein GCM10012280_31150 [Wenjunlia tyrosinilytica]
MKSRFLQDPDLVPRFTTLIVLVVTIGFCTVAVFNLWRRDPSLPVLIGAIACLTLLTALQISLIAARTRPLRRRWGPYVLLAQTPLVYVPFIVADNGWVGMPGFLAGSALLVLRPVYAWTVFAIVSLSIGGVQLLLHSGLLDTIYFMISSVITSLMVYGLSRLSDLVREVHEARAELARLAVTQERLRFARDLHDLLGYSLSAITLKSELVYRLVDRHPARAKRELEQVLELARQALADVREVSTSYRQMSLGAECASARSVLSAADIHVDMAVSIQELNGAANTVLATVLREGITNVLRHSKAQRCEIRAASADGKACLTIVNDGVRRPQHPSERKGTGIDNLDQRLEILGGSLEAGVREDGRFQLVARVPVSFPDDRAATVAEDGSQEAESVPGETAGKTADHTAA